MKRGLVALAVVALGCSETRYIGSYDASLADGAVADAGLDPIESAAAVCVLASACLHGQVQVSRCVELVSRAGDAASYRSVFEGQANTAFDATGVSRLDAEYVAMIAEPGVRTCLASARTCDDVFSCLDRGAASPACTPGSGAASCSGSVLTTCAVVDRADPSQGREVSLDCALAGNLCETSVELGAVCAAGSCDSATFTPTCEGALPGIAVDCSPAFGVLSRRPCTAPNRCMTSGANAFCATATACGATFVPRCNAGRFEQCLGGRVQSVECEDACQEVSGTGFCGVAADCDPSSTPATCAGALVRTCALGRVVDIDCMALLGSRCVLDARTGEGVCAP